MKFWFLTVNYKQTNDILQLIETLSNLEMYDEHEISLCIIDNSGELNNYEINSDFIHIKQENNIGYIKGLSEAFKMSNRLGSEASDTVILTNPDVVFDKTFLKDTIKAKKYITKGILAPEIICFGKKQNPNMKFRPSRAWYYLHDLEMSSYAMFVLSRALKLFINKTMFFLRNLTTLFRRKNDSFQKNYTKFEEIYQLHGSCMISNVENINVTDCLNFNLFLLGEEAVISAAFRFHNLSVTFYPNIVVHHNEHSATNLIVGRKKYKIWKQSYDVYRSYL